MREVLNQYVRLTPRTIRELSPDQVHASTQHILNTRHSFTQVLINHQRSAVKIPAFSIHLLTFHGVDFLSINITDIHHKGFLSNMEDLFGSSKYSDLTISCGSDEYKVHRAIICQLSDFFATACDGAFLV